MYKSCSWQSRKLLPKEAAAEMRYRSLVAKSSPETNPLVKTPCKFHSCLHPLKHLRKMALRKRPSPSNMPPEITSFDHQASVLGITSSTTALHPSKLQTTKKETQSESERIIELTKENGSLRQELGRCRDIIEAWSSLYGAILEAYKLLKTAKEVIQEGLHRFGERQLLADEKLSLYWGIDIEKGDIRVI